MQQLMILRHAQAAGCVSGTSDFSRPLTESGTIHAGELARYISANLELPEDILCSPARRTRETLAPLLLDNPELENVAHFVPQIYNAPFETLLSLLDFTFTEKDRALIVGHNPGIGQLASELLSGSAERPFSAMPAGTLVVIDFDPGWGIGSGKGALNRRVTQTELSID